MRAVSAETATRVHPSIRSFAGDGGRAATSTAVAIPGAEATSTAGTRYPASVMTPIERLASAATANVARRVAATARASPPPRTRRITTRTASIVVVNSTANGIATASATAVGTPAASAIGIVTLANADAAAISPCQDLSRPPIITPPTNSAAIAGTTSDQRTSGGITIAAPTPATEPATAQMNNHRTAANDNSRRARAPRCPSMTAAGSWPRKPATAATPSSAPAGDGPATANAV